MGGGDPLPVRRIDAGSHVGAAIADRVVLFSRTGMPVAEPVSFEVTGAEPVKVLVTGLCAGAWRLSGPESAEFGVTAEGGEVYFTGSSGAYVLTRSHE